jgi:hypothetical protein
VTPFPSRRRLGRGTNDWSVLKLESGESPAVLILHLRNRSR